MSKTKRGKVKFPITKPVKFNIPAPSSLTEKAEEEEAPPPNGQEKEPLFISPDMEEKISEIVNFLKTLDTAEFKEFATKLAANVHPNKLIILVKRIDQSLVQIIMSIEQMKVRPEGLPDNLKTIPTRKYVPPHDLAPLMNPEAIREEGEDSLEDYIRADFERRFGIKWNDERIEKLIRMADELRKQESVKQQINPGDLADAKRAGAFAGGVAGAFIEAVLSNPTIQQGIGEVIRCIFGFKKGEGKRGDKSDWSEDLW